MAKNVRQYLLIDGNNLAVRNVFANETLTNSDGIHSGVHFGVMTSLVSLRKRYPNAQMLLAWDGKSEYRMKISKDAMEKGLVPELYKACRKKDVMPKPLLDFYAQADYLKRGIGTLGIPQIQYSNQEADDVIASYAKKLSDHSEVVLVTSDKDYYQMLKENVSIYDGMKNQSITEYDFKNNTGLSPAQWVDVGALMGDDGDSIWGIPGWGDKTAIKEIIKYKDYNSLIYEYTNSTNDLRKKYPDLDPSNTEDIAKFDVLRNEKSDKGKVTYPGIDIKMPYTGVLYAYNEGSIKIPKTTIMCLVFQDRVRIAYKLKKSIDNIENLPEIYDQPQSKENLMSYFDVYEIDSLRDSIEIFFRREQED